MIIILIIILNYTKHIYSIQRKKYQAIFKIY